MKGNIIIISAPSGTGKTTILKEIMADIAKLAFSVSHTTRSPRTGEINGQDYHFVSKEEFHTIKQADGFIEWAEVHGNFYGTSKESIIKQINNGYDVILDIDIQGARQVRQKLPQASSIFISPPSWREQEKRLTGRGTDDQKTIQLRLANAKKEMAAQDQYDFVIINDALIAASQVMTAIIFALRAKSRRNMAGEELHLPTADNDL